jgi:hypothetical protein
MVSPAHHLGDNARADTVDAMLFVLLGLAAGAAVAFGKIPVISPAATAVADGVVGAAVNLLDAALGAAAVDLSAPLAVATRAAVVALMPGIVAALLLGAARGSLVTRRLAAVAAILAGGYVAFTQPAPAGIIGGVLLAVVGLSLAFLVTTALAVVTAAVAGLLAATQIRLFFDSEANRFSETADALAAAAGVGDPRWWTLVLVAASLAMSSAVFWHALRD